MPPVFQPCTSLGLTIICRLDENGERIGANGFPDIRYHNYHEALTEEDNDKIDYFGLSYPDYKFKFDFQFPVNLTSLSLRGCKIKSFINVILPKKLIRLDLSFNHIKKIPDDLPESLIYLNVSDNNIRRLWCIPPNLQTLICNNNSIDKLPKEFPNSLRDIKLHNNRITKLPKLIPDSVKSLEIQNNLLFEIPISIADCQEIEVQWEGNFIQELPIEIDRVLLTQINNEDYRNFIINKNV